MRRIALMVAAAVATLARADNQSVPDAAAIPAGYREWKLITVAREEGKLDDVRAILGNDIAIKAAQEGKAPFPDGTIIARLAWSFDSLAQSTQAFGQPQSHVAGQPKNGVQFMVKDSSKYVATGGWGYVQFDGGKPSNSAAQRTCFACHSIVKERDFVFNGYAAAPGVHP